MKHSNFLKVKVLDSVQPNEVLHVFQEDASVKPDSSPYGPIGRPRQKSNYELFNRNNFNIRYWSWNYRGCWHQTCPPIDTRKGI